MRRITSLAITAVALLAVAACGGNPAAMGSGAGKAGQNGENTSASALAPDATLTLRLGYLASITQAPVLAGIRQQLFATSLAPRVALRTIPYSSDTAEAEALATRKLDAAYASPGAILSLEQAHPGSIRVVSGAACGGSELVTAHHIRSPAQLKGATLAVPAAGGDQDIALSYWLAQHHLTTSGPHHVTIISMPSGPAVVAAFRAGRIDGAWYTAPYDAQMLTSHGHLVASPNSLYPGGCYPTASLVVSTAFLDHHTAAVLALLKGQAQANDYFHHALVQAALAATSELAAVTHHHLSARVLAASLAQLTYTDDPNPAALAAQARWAGQLGFPMVTASTRALYDLAPLDLVLHQAGEPGITT